MFDWESIHCELMTSRVEFAHGPSQHSNAVDGDETVRGNNDTP